MAGPEFAALDVGVLQEIEGILCLDVMPDPGVILPLADREQSRGWQADDSLDDDLRKALDGEWLHATEIAAFQRLRGWNRTRYGQVKVRTEHLLEAVSVLGTLLTGAFDVECEETLRELDCPGNEAELAAAKALMEATGHCGDCNYDRLCALQDRCNAALDATGIERGIEYRTAVLGQSVARANREVYGYCIWCNTHNNACADPAHLAATYPDREVA
jgi:hypothetical protein